MTTKMTSLYDELELRYGPAFMQHIHDSLQKTRAREAEVAKTKKDNEMLQVLTTTCAEAASEKKAA